MSTEETEYEGMQRGNGGVNEDDADVGADGVKCHWLIYKH